MPVHRVPGGKRSRVFASRSEIDAWLQDGNEGATEVPPDHAVTALPRQKIALWVVGTMVLFAIVVLGLVRRRSAEGIAKMVFRGDTVAAIDAGNREIWIHRYPANFDLQLLPDPQNLEHYVRFVDLYGDGRHQVLLLAPYHLGPNPGDTFRVELDCFSDDGKLLWVYVPQESLQFGDHFIDSDWHVSDIFVAPHPELRILVSVYHHTWGNSFVAQLDPRSGTPTLRFVNTGIIHSLNELVVGSKRYLLAGGFNNEHDSGILAVIDEQTPFAASPQTKGTRHYCESCPPGSTDYYLVFPRSELNHVSQIYEDQVQDVKVRGAEVQAIKMELHDLYGVSTTYKMRVDAGVHPLSLRHDSSYDMRHRSLSQQGKLRHSLENCPERLDPQPTRMWTPSSGWTFLKFPAAKAYD
jgi:hypothetical protein